MIIDFQDPELERLAFDAAYMGKRSAALVRAYRKRINQLRNVPDRQALYALRSLRLEKLKGKLKRFHSMRINDQYRLIIEIQQKVGKETVEIIKIEDYH